MNKVMVRTASINGRQGYDVEVKSEDATVQDYLDAVNSAIEKHPLDRARSPGRSECAGCDLCCQERAPLTWIDLLNLKTVPGIDEKDFSLQEFLKKAGYIVIDGPVVDIMLRRDEKDNKCIFLDRESRLCTIYKYRPLVCQLYICSPATRRAKRLWEAVINQGEDELVRNWLEETLQAGKNIYYDEGYEPAPRTGDWEYTPFTGKNCYSGVRLKEVCQPQLWKLLRSG